MYVNLTQFYLQRLILKMDNLYQLAFAQRIGTVIIVISFAMSPRAPVIHSNTVNEIVGNVVVDFPLSLTKAPANAQTFFKDTMSTAQLVIAAGIITTTLDILTPM
jgi:hypothetical protein